MFSMLTFFCCCFSKALFLLFSTEKFCPNGNLILLLYILDSASPFFFLFGARNFNAIVYMSRIII